MSRDGDWYINGGFRLNLAEVTAIQPISGLNARVVVHLRGVAAPMELYATAVGASELLEVFDAWRSGL